MVAWLRSRLFSIRAKWRMYDASGSHSTELRSRRSADSTSTARKDLSVSSSASRAAVLSGFESNILRLPPRMFQVERS